MASTAIALCVYAFLVQTITAQSIGVANGLQYTNYASPSNCQSNQPSTSTFIVTSTSPIAATGIQILAENLAIDGILNVGGRLPLLGTVVVEGDIQSQGQAGVQYGCGSTVSITSELNPANLNSNQANVANRQNFAGQRVNSNFNSANFGLNAGQVVSGNAGFNGASLANSAALNSAIAARRLGY